MSTPASGEAEEAKELSLVGKVELRLALAESDAKLEATLNTYLTPLLLKLASKHSSVRNKVISICQHINTRTKSSSLNIPVPALLKQYKDTNKALIRHYDLLHIQQGLPRLAVQERENLLPQLLKGLSINFQESAAQAAILFNLSLKLLHDLSLPTRGTQEDARLRTTLGFVEQPEEAEFVATWLGKLMLFNANWSPSKGSPGLSVRDCEFLQLHGKEETWVPSMTGGMNLTDTKTVAIKFLGSGAFIDKDRFLPALFASADANSRLSDLGEDILKRSMPNISLDDKDLLHRLFEVYLGDQGPSGSLPARTPLRIRILVLLCKSTAATSFVQQNLDIIQDGLIPQNQSQASTSSKGLEMSKLRGHIFTYVTWISRISSPVEIKTFAPKMAATVGAYIENQGWPQLRSDVPPPGDGDLKSRNTGYETIGLLAKACPDELLSDQDLKLLSWLFESLSSDSSSSDVRYSIEQSLSSVLGALAGGSATKSEASIAELMLQHMNLKPGDRTKSGNQVVRSTRFIAIRFSNRCLPYSNTTGRWVDLLAIGGGPEERNEVIEEGRKGLDPYWFRNLNPPKTHSMLDKTPQKQPYYQFPTFDSLIEEFYNSGKLWDPLQIDNSSYQLVHAYASATHFCRYVLLHQMLQAVSKVPEVNVDWERNIDALVFNDQVARAKLKEQFSHASLDGSSSRQNLVRYLQAAFRGATNSADSNAHLSAKCLLDICTLSPDSLSIELRPEIPRLQDGILSYDHSLRTASAYIFGLLASHKGHSIADGVQAMVHTFQQKLGSWRQAVGSESLKVHGSLLAMAYLISRSSSRDNMSSGAIDRQSTFISTTLGILQDSRDKMLLEAAAVAVSELSLFAVLRPDTVPSSSNVSLLTSTLTKRARTGDEKAIIALSYFAMQCAEEDVQGSILDQIIKDLVAVNELRQAELQFVVGAALSCAAAGWQSTYLMAAQDYEGETPSYQKRAKTLSSVLDQVLLECKSSKPAMRQASVIWLLCLVQYCGHLQELQARLRDCQIAFKGFLADRELLNQETASRGLTLLYERGDRTMKDALIRDLVGSFTGTNAGLAGNVSSDTELFDPGALPTGDGSVTTYKDIMSLASEAGDPSLVYRFMSLASNNAIWSSRAAFGRFGLSNILSDSSVDGYLAENPKLYPALFRYRFDPNSNVRNSMNDIWAALVKDPAKTIDIHFDAIINDLMKNVLGKEWRSRQASCAALADLIHGVMFEKYERYLSQIWTVTFKVCDDIKDSVRKAAMALARVLTGILTRSLEAGEQSNRTADAMLANILPFLLGSSGLESSAQEVQAFALSTLLQIIKSGNGKILRPFIPDLIGRLLALLSSLEPEAVNYIHLNAEKYGVTAEQIDDVRLSSVRVSPMMEALEHCLDFLDEVTMANCCPTLDNAIKTVIGLPSKVGCCRLLVSLSTRHNFLFKTHATRFLKLARKQVLDRNETVSLSYASACGYLARLASDEEILGLIEFCTILYFDSENDRQRAISGEVILAVSKYATDRFHSLAGAVMPLIFIAKHDINDHTKEVYEETWNDNAGGSRAVLLYLREIVSLALQYLGSPRWSVKHTSAFAIAAVIDSAGSTITAAHANLIWPALEKAVSGKTWEGKEVILKAVVKYAKISSSLPKETRTADNIQRILFRESKRNNPKYRQEALACLGSYVELMVDDDLFPQVYDTIEPLVQVFLNDSEMDIDSPNGGSSSATVVDASLAYALGALLKSIYPRLRGESEAGGYLKNLEVAKNALRTSHFAGLISSLSRVLHLLEKTVASRNASRLVQNQIYDGQIVLFDRLAAHACNNNEVVQGSLEEILIRYVQTLFPSQNQSEETRNKAARAATALTPCARAGLRLRESLRTHIRAAHLREPASSVQQELERAKKALEMYN